MVIQLEAGLTWTDHRVGYGDSAQRITLKPGRERMVNEITSIVEKLGGETALGRPVRTREDMKAAIREGFPQAVVQALVEAFRADLAGGRIESRPIGP